MFRNSESPVFPVFGGLVNCTLGIDPPSNPLAKYFGCDAADP